MKLVKKNAVNNLIEAICQVSGYSEELLMNSRTHSVTPWVHLGMYLAHESGLSHEKAAKLFGRSAVASWKMKLKVEGELTNPQVQDAAQEILRIKGELDNNEA